MSNKFLKRLFTSIILLIILFIINYSDTQIVFLSLVIISIIILVEFIYIYKKFLGPLILKYDQKSEIPRKINLNYLTLNIVTTFYLIFIFLQFSYKIHFYKSPTFFFFVISICFFSDIGGYIIGKTIGGKRLTKISPNKTISGTIGSFIFCLIPIPIFSYTNIDLKLNFILIIFCISISMINQLGDLFVSYLKRKAKIKDTGKILPGHGGLLDRFDGIIFALPFSYLLVNIT